ncbi:MAG: hypothetical protein HYT27_00280 [Parcubacteria group bacterium]|nr:hypothetical protein [Parcubacteria group bacterium]
MCWLNFRNATLTELAKAANIPRTAAYPPLETLLKRGLLSSIKIGKRVHYRSLDPKQLPALLERNKTRLEEVIQNLSQRIEIPAGDVSVQYFPGLRGIEVAGDIFLNETKTKLWKTFENPLYIVEKGGVRGFDTYISRRVAKKIHARIITPANRNSGWIQKRLERQKEELVEVVMVSPEAYPIESSLAITEGMVLMLAAKAIPFAILIKNPELARTMESVHDMAWDRYRPT